MKSLPEPIVRFIGDVDHADFRDVAKLLRVESRFVAETYPAPELVVIAQSHPGSVRRLVLEEIRRQAPLAGVIVLAGTWSEGETRTGRPWPGTRRLYWYEFPGWWRRQIAILAAGHCPDWARPAAAELHAIQYGAQIDQGGKCGTIIINAAYCETVDALADVLCRAGYATVWQASDALGGRFRGSTIGIWDGGQLCDREVFRLSRFCRVLSADAVPVVAMLDFPRRDHIDLAIELGASAVLGKPWNKSDLMAVLRLIVESKKTSRAA